MIRSDPTERTTFKPLQAHTLEETGLPFGLVFDLLLKHAYFEGTATLGRLADRSKLGPQIVHAVYRHWQKEQLCGTTRMVDDDYEIVLTTKGREMAEVALKKGQYAGPAPVALSDYNGAVSKQGIPVRITADTLKAALDDLTVGDDLIYALGSALSTGGAILLYGGTGNGKTSISERLHRLFSDTVYVPYAVEISGYTVSVFDPLIHRAQRTDEDDDGADARWCVARGRWSKSAAKCALKCWSPASMKRPGCASLPFR